jgi:hypothetical protein
VSFITPYGLVKRVRNLYLFETDAAAPPSPPPVLIQQIAAITNFGTSHSVILPAPVGAGNTLIYAMSTNGVPTPFNFTDNQGNIYTPDFVNNVGGNIGYFLRSSNILNAPNEILFESDIPTLFVVTAWEYQNLDNVTPVASTNSTMTFGVENTSLTFPVFVNNAVALSYINPNALLTPSAVPPSFLNVVSLPTVLYGLSRLTSLVDNTIAAEWTGQGVADPRQWGVLYNPA